MQIIDSKFKANAARYVIQCVLATVSILVILLFLNVFQQTAIIASLGASTFIAFAMPSAYSSKPRGLIGGYLMGTIIGISTNQLFISLSSHISVIAEEHYIAFGAIAVGLTIFAMVVTNTEHPPAVGMALALVLNQWTFSNVVFILIAVLMLALIKHTLRDFLIDLH